MSLSGHFSSKWVNQDKSGREIKTHEDYRAARIRHADGSDALYRGCGPQKLDPSCEAIDSGRTS